MVKHINFFGYSLWIPNDRQQKSDQKLSSRKSFYSPSVLAAYCILTSSFVGIILYGSNIFRRGYLWRGRVFIVLSSLLLVASIFFPLLNQLGTMHLLVALNLYAVEKLNFQRAIRSGSKQARWWLPLIWIGVIVGMLLLLKILV